MLVLGVILFAFLGTAAGVVTGLTPGLHVNTIAALVLALQGSLIALASSIFAWAGPNMEELLLMVASMIVGNVVSHTFLDFIPSIFLGAPEGETALSVLPGHRMLLQGRGLEAVRLSAQGSLAAALLSLLLVLPMRLIMGPPVSAYDDLRPYLHLLLLLVASIFIISERGRILEVGKELVCVVPEGVLHPDEPPPQVQQLGPGEAASAEEAFLLRGRALSRGAGWLEVGDQTGRVKVTLRGELLEELTGDVALFVAPERRMDRSSGLTQRGWGLLVFLLSGALGWLVLESPLMESSLFPLPIQGDPSTLAFLPLFTGLFGLPTMLLSLLRTPRIPAQDLEPETTERSPLERARATLSGSLAGAFVAWIPGVTAATATVLSQLFSGREEGERQDEEFILSLSCVNTATAVFTIVALFTLLRARSGGMVAVQAIAGSLVVQWDPLVLVPVAMAALLIAATVAAGASFYLTLYFGGLFSRLANRIPYRWLVLSVLILLVLLIVLLSGSMGAIVAAVATAIGLLPPLVGVRRVHLMGSLLLPLILLLP